MKLSGSIKVDSPSPVPPRSVKLAPVQHSTPAPASAPIQVPETRKELSLSPRPAKKTYEQPERDVDEYSNNSPITVNREEPFINSPRSPEPERVAPQPAQTNPVVASSQSSFVSSSPFKPNWSANASPANAFPGFSFQRQKKPWEK